MPQTAVFEGQKADHRVFYDDRQKNYKFKLFCYSTVLPKVKIV